MATTKTELAFNSALLSTGLVQPVDTKSNAKTLEILCRQVPGQEKTWLGVVKNMLVAASELELTSGGVELHVCRRYVMREGNMVFGWHLGIEAKNAKALAEAVQTFNSVLAKAKPMLVPEEEPQQQDLVRRNGSETTSNPRQFRPGPGNTVVPRQRGVPLAPGRHPTNVRAHPRAPGLPGTVDEPPEDFNPAIRTVRNDHDESGNQVIWEEMPLPHVFHEMNVPNEKGKGASYMGRNPPARR